MYDLEDKKLKRVEPLEYLGLIFDYRMKWNLHTLSIVKRTRYLIYVIARLKNFYGLQSTNANILCTFS